MLPNTLRFLLFDLDTKVDKILIYSICFYGISERNNGSISCRIIDNMNVRKHKSRHNTSFLEDTYVRPRCYPVPGVRSNHQNIRPSSLEVFLKHLLTEQIRLGA